MKKFLTLTTLVAFGAFFDTPYSKASDILPLTDTPEFHKVARQLIVGVVDSDTPLNDSYIYTPIFLENEDKENINKVFQETAHDEVKVTLILRALRHCMLEKLYVQNPADKTFQMESTASDVHRIMEENIKTVFKDQMSLFEEWQQAAWKSFSANGLVAFVGEKQEKELEKQILSKFNASPSKDNSWTQLQDALSFVADKEDAMPAKKTTVAAGSSSSGSSSSAPSSKGIHPFFKTDELDAKTFNTISTEDLRSLSIDSAKRHTLANQIIYPLNTSLNTEDAEKQEEEQNKFNQTKLLLLNSSLIHDKEVEITSATPATPTLKLRDNRFPNLVALCLLKGTTQSSPSDSLKEIYEGNPHLKYVTLKNLAHAYWERLKKEGQENQDGFIEKMVFSADTQKNIHITFKDRIS